MCKVSLTRFEVRVTLGGGVGVGGLVIKKKLNRYSKLCQTDLMYVSDDPISENNYPVLSFFLILAEKFFRILGLFVFFTINRPMS